MKLAHVKLAGVLSICALSAQAGKWLTVVRTNAPTPPVVIATNVTPQPPVADVKRWSFEQIWHKGADYKIMVAHDVPRGTIISFYNRKTRTNSRIEERGPDGQWREIWNGPEETIGQAPVVLGAALWKGGHVFAAEVGRTFLRYDHASGKIQRLAAVPSGYKWNVFPAVWNARHTVAIGGVGPATKAAVFDAFTGRELFRPPLSGLIAGMAEDAAGVMWCAIADGQRGVCTSDGRQWQDFSAASIAHPWGRPTAGSMDDGWLWQYRGGRWAKWIDLDASKVNRMVYDARRDVLLVAASNPDTFAAVRADGTVERIARFEDQAKSKSGEQFDATIDVGHGNTVIFARSTEKGTFAYRGKPSQ